MSSYLRAPRYRCCEPRDAVDGVHHPSATGTLVGSSGVVAKNTLASKWSHAASRLLANGSTVGLEKASSDNGGGGSGAVEADGFQKNARAAERVGEETTIRADSSHGAGSEESGGGEELFSPPIHPESREEYHRHFFHSIHLGPKLTAVLGCQYAGRGTSQSLSRCTMKGIGREDGSSISVAWMPWLGRLPETHNTISMTA